MKAPPKGSKKHINGPGTCTNVALLSRREQKEQRESERVVYKLTIITNNNGIELVAFCFRRV
jgi:hypothetical protein